MIATSDGRIISYYYTTSGYDKGAERGTPLKRLTIWMSEDELALIQTAAEARHRLIDSVVGATMTTEEGT